jgi:hypothetical protein
MSWIDWRRWAAVQFSNRGLAALEMLAKRFNFDLTAEGAAEDPEYLYVLLKRLEEEAASIYSDSNRQRPSEEALAAVSSQLRYTETVSTTLGIDYDLELKRTRRLLSPEEHPSLLEYLVSLPGRFSSEGLVNENHGFGYHIHYVVLKKKLKRTNVLFTFNPKEVVGVGDKLYWETHGSAFKSEPERFGNRRRNAIYDTSCAFLKTVSKSEFRAPSSNAQLLWPK